MKKEISAGRVVLLIVTILFAPVIWAQQSAVEDVFYRTDSTLFGNKQTRVFLRTDYGINGSSLPNYFLVKAYSGSFLDADIKQTAVDRLKARNRIGLQADVALGATWMIKSTRMSAEVGHREFFSMRYAEDLFKLVFVGNYEYLNKKADISNTYIKTFNYQYLKVGAEKELSKKVVAGGSLSLLRGGRYQHFKTSRGTLFTEEFGSYLELDADLHSELSPRDTSRRFESNGKGAAVDLYTRIAYKKAVIEVSVTDLGIIAWKNLKMYDGDGTFRYSGQEAEDLLAPNSSLTTGLVGDTVLNDIGIKTSRSNKIMMLPFSLQASWRKPINEKMSHQVLLRHTRASGYIPRLSYRHYWFLKPALAIVNTVSYGGFGRGDYEVGVLYKVKDKFIVAANFHAAEMLILPKKSSGNGFNMTLVGMF